MNITFLVNRDLASNLALNHLLPRLAGQHRLQVFLSDKVGAGGEMPAALGELRFFEQSLFNELLFPALDRAGDSEGLRTFEQLQTYTRNPIQALNRPNDPEGLLALRDSEPELLVSIRYGRILREEAISIPRLGVINLHSGLLPDYRGVMATFRGLLAEETEIGTTLHYIVDAGIDTGPVIDFTRAPVEAGKSYLWHVLHLYPGACQRLAAIIECLDRGEPVPTRPQDGGGAYYGFPDEDELARFHELGRRLYDLEDITALGRQYLGVTT